MKLQAPTSTWTTYDYNQPNGETTATELLAAITLSDENGLTGSTSPTLASCTIVASIQRWDSTEEEWYDLDSST